MGFVKRMQESNIRWRGFLARLTAWWMVLALIIAPVWSQNQCQTPQNTSVGFDLRTL